MQNRKLPEAPRPPVEVTNYDLHPTGPMIDMVASFRGSPVRESVLLSVRHPKAFPPDLHRAVRLPDLRLMSDGNQRLTFFPTT